jgi:UDP-3-O-[3-hydroxymyristoyl] glucosamine N-acyltransferase
MEISSQLIKSTLGQLEIDYIWKNYEDKTYIVASLFSPISFGFYFYTGKDNFNLNTKNSLIILNIEPADSQNNNQFIILKEKDPQQVFYLILNFLYKKVSSGVVASTSIISSNSYIGKNVQVDDFCIIEENVRIEDGVIIGSHSKIHANTIIKKGSILESACVIGTQGVAWIWNNDQTEKIIQPQLGGVLIDENCFIGAGTVIVRGSLNENTQIGKNTLMAPGGRIGHGTKIGNFVHFANSVVTGGNTIVGDYSFVGSASVFRPKVSIHAKTIVGAGSVVVKNTTGEGFTLKGVPAKQSETNLNPSGMPKPKL